MNKKEIRRRAMALFKEEHGILPQGYTACDYIRMSAAYNTGVRGRDNMSIQSKFRRSGSSTNIDVRLFSIYQNSVSMTPWGVSVGWGALAIDYGKVNLISIGGYLSLGTLAEIKVKFGTTKVELEALKNGTVTTRSAVPTQQPDYSKATIWMRPAGNGWFDLYHSTIYYDLDFNTACLDYYPCVEDATGNAGFWDTVSNSFKHGSGMTAGYDA